MPALFWIAAVVAILTTTVALTRAEAVHALLWAAVSLLAVAVLFATLGAPLVAALEVIVYAGAILVLFVFVVMLLSLGRDELFGSRRAWIGPGATALLLVGVLIGSQTQPSGMARTVPPEAVANSLLQTYLVGVELVSLLLLAGLLAAWHLSRRHPDERSPR
jgi:NADH-quinone oxidoreductase subunit J